MYVYLTVMYRNMGRYKQFAEGQSAVFKLIKERPEMYQLMRLNTPYLFYSLKVYLFSLHVRNVFHTRPSKTSSLFSVNGYD